MLWPPSSTTASCWNSFTTPSFISSATQNNLSSPSYLNGNIPWLTIVSQITISTHTSTSETHKRVLRFEKGEAHTYKRDWMTTWRRFHNLCDDNIGGGSFNDEPVVERRNCCYVEEGSFAICNNDVQKWKREKWLLLHAKKMNSGMIYFKP